MHQNTLGERVMNRAMIYLNLNKWDIELNHLASIIAFKKKLVSIRRLLIIPVLILFSFIFLIEGREEISKFSGRKIVINKMVKMLGILYFEKKKIEIKFSL